MCRKLFCFLIATLMLCPQVNASTFSFTSPSGGTVWGRGVSVIATGTTSAPAADKIRVGFGYFRSGSEITENYVIHTVIGTATGTNSWMVTIAPPSYLWPGICWTGCWEPSPIIAYPPPSMMYKDHFVRVADEPAVAGAVLYRNDQGVSQ